jgi:tRNA G10  N-methylase Trm11
MPSQVNRIRPIHPFPARMAPEIVWNELSSRRSLRVLDQMAGSGTTLVAAKMHGHTAIGYDRDPLAVLIARSWLANVSPEKIEETATAVIKRARIAVNDLRLRDAYPRGADEETKCFVRYWFDETNRKQLAALSSAIPRVGDSMIRDVLWCAFSRLIITKQAGASLAMDVSHSRPHKTYERAPRKALNDFQNAVRRITRSCPFAAASEGSQAVVSLGDARSLPLPDSDIDLVITSPPYLNAIDYLRGHKFSLIWMGHTIASIRNIRMSNVGTEVAAKPNHANDSTDRIMRQMCNVDGLSQRHAGMLRRYVQDIRQVMAETKRVLRTGGRAVFVIGNCSLRDVFVKNSKCIEALANELGMLITKRRTRLLRQRRRYLPPPQSRRAGKRLGKRLREEVLITLLKTR